MRRTLASLLVALLPASAAFVALLPAAPPASSATASTYRSNPVRVVDDETGATTTVEQRHVSLTVSATSNLRGRQVLDVRWTGAHPTGGTVGDPNSGSAARQEYPFVLMQCRGRGDQVTPDTCWTSSPSERYQRSNPQAFEWPAFRSDAFASAADRVQFAGVPSPLPTDCKPVTFGAERWVPFRAADGTVYPGGPTGCGGQAPESSVLTDVGMPSNTTYAITATDGTGQARFAVWSAEENTSLGCSSSVPCSLVAVPIVGLSCDAWGTRLPADEAKPTGTVAARANDYCAADGVYEPGEPAVNGQQSDLAVTGSLWWSASNWRNRITVPLSFAASANQCSTVNDDEPLSVFGSVLMNEVTASWMPKFCTTKGLSPFVHVQAADSAARNLITAGTASAVFASEPSSTGYGRPVVQAPVALSGYAVAFDIDGDDGQPVDHLRLDARLLAKLMTQSYPATPGIRSAYAKLGDNPLNITLDPEFQALNPGLPERTTELAAATVFTLSTDSDLMWALTSYLQNDPEAREFLDGVPDPWGMRVNPNYRRIELPVSSWQLLDGFELAHDSLCYDHSPSPILGLIASPPSQLATLVQSLQFSISNATTICPDNADANDPTTLRLRAQGRQTPGRRFLLGVVPLTAVDRYGLTAASLQTTSSASLDDPFTDATGRTFVTPDDAGLKAAGTLLEPDDDAGLWTMPYADLHTAAGATAYPGTMPVFATVPTDGLSADAAGRVAQLLDYAAGPGQVRGLQNGQLPAGALPLTEADGLGALSAYTSCAAEAVRAQRGDVPIVGATTCRLSTATPTTTPSPSPTTTPTTAAPPVSVPSGVVGPIVDAPSPGGARAAAPPTPAPVAAVSETPFTTTAAATGLGRLGLPVAAFLAVLLAVFGVVLRWGDLAAGGVVRGVRSGSARWRAWRGSRPRTGGRR